MPRELDQQLVQAVKQNSLREVEALLEAGARPGKTLLKQVHPRRDDIRAALVLAGADGTELGLLWAVSTGRPEVVDRLLEQGATNSLALLHACGQGSVEIVDRLLRAGADPDAGNTVATPLLNALKNGHGPAARRLLEAGANPSHTPQFVPCTPVFQAVASNLPDLLEALLAAGGDTGRPFPHTTLDEAPVETPPVVLAARLGHAACLRALLAAGADAQARDGKGRTAYEVAADQATREVLGSFGILETQPRPEEELLLAAEQGDLEALERALAAGAAVNSRDRRDDSRGCTALHLAGRAGHLRAVERLLAAGADPALTDLEGKKHPYLSYLYSEGGEDGVRAAGERLGRTALMLAAQAGHDKICEVLSGPVDARDAVGMTALLLAAEQGHRPVVELLLARGANRSHKGPGKCTALSLASAAGHRELAAWLGTRGRKPSRAEVTSAVEQLDRELLESLIARGADLEKGACLCAAAGASRWESHGLGKTLVPRSEEEILPVLELLLAHGAPLDAVGTTGTALAAAVLKNQPRVVSRLLEAGADVHARDGSGQSAHDLAQRLGRLELLGRQPPPPPAPEPKVRQPIMAPVPKLKAFAGFSTLVAELSERCANRPVALGAGVRCAVRVARRQEFDRVALQARFAERGALLFELEPGEVVLLPTRDPLQAVAFMQTSGANDGIGSGDIVAFLRALEVPWRLSRLQHDLLEVELLEPVAKPEGLARRCRSLCPDLEPREALAQVEQGRLFFWWD